LKFVNEGAEPVLTTIHFAPVWGGTGDTIPATQTLTVERSYISVKEADLRSAISVGDNVGAETVFQPLVNGGKQRRAGLE
jgi:hypothetical protein